MIQTRLVLIALTLAVAAAAGCSKQPVPGAAAAAATATSSVAPQAPATAPVAAHGSAGPASATEISGEVAETMDAGTYTYVRVTTATGDVWAAANKFDVKVGDRVTVPLEMPMENFHSKSLGRDFPLIYFASRITRAGEAGAGGAQASETGTMQMPPGHPAARETATVTDVIPQPDGGTAIATIWQTRKALAGKSVTVRGKVVKVNSGIMGRNWIHLQDGTGAATDRTNDLTVTSDDEARVGDVVTATGTIAVDRDFGAGYAYPVILEKAKLATKPAQ